MHHASPPRTIFQLILMEAYTLSNTISTSNTNSMLAQVPEVMGYADDTGESAVDNYLGSTTVHMILDQQWCTQTILAQVLLEH